MMDVEADWSGPKPEDKTRRGLAWSQIAHHTWLKMFPIF